MGLATTPTAATAADARTLTFSRHFRATPAQVYAAWTDPAALPRWWGPEGWTCETHAMDLREGGEWRFTMRGEGMEFPNRHRWTALVPHERIEFLMDGMDGEEPKAVTVRLSPEGTGTRLTQVMVFPSAEAAGVARSYGAEAKGLETLAKLAQALGE
jgi:uncharacterized protein YndB with AHSA1/START domain